MSPDDGQVTVIYDPPLRDPKVELIVLGTWLGMCLMGTGLPAEGAAIILALQLHAAGLL